MNRIYRICAMVGLSLTAAATTPMAVAQGEALPAGSARVRAPVDLTGYWVSIVTQDWLFRMVVLQRGQYNNVPINAKSMAFADAWDRARDEAAGKQCEAYGAAAIMQVPERLHISWQDDNTLRVDTDAGRQTRLLHFSATAPSVTVAPSWQGDTSAQWMVYRDRTAAPGAAPQYGWLKAATDNLLPGLLRKNGVPYSAQTRMTESWVLNVEDDGDQWLTVNTELTDPVYLSGPYVENAIFKKESDGVKWDPTPCSLE